MPIPRRLPERSPAPAGASGGHTGACAAAAAGRPDYRLTEHVLAVSNDFTTKNSFEKLSLAFTELSLTVDTRSKKERMVARHPTFRAAVAAYGAMLKAVNPRYALSADDIVSFPGDANARVPSDRDLGGAKVRAPLDSDLDEAMGIFVELCERRTAKALAYQSVVGEFILEYSQAVEELTAVEPILKGSRLAEKVERLKQRVSEQYKGKVTKLKLECSVKRRRTNFTEESIAVLRAWFGQHEEHPYPTPEEKKTLARAAGVTEDQLQNWFVNVRKRYWKDPSRKKATQHPPVSSSKRAIAKAGKRGKKCKGKRAKRFSVQADNDDSEDNQDEWDDDYR